jgi:hypothetical protein
MTWTPVAQPSGTWTALAITAVFDPAVFDLLPVFDTGSTATRWTPEPKPTNTWNNV